jgi:hypothetical protein
MLTHRDIPHVGVMPLGYHEHFANKSFDNCSPDPVAPHRRISYSNHQHAIAASYDADAGRLGFTGDGYGSNFSYVYVQSITDKVRPNSGTPIRGANAGIVGGETYVHELVHQFDVNEGQTGAHCTNTAYVGSRLCLMNDTNYSHLTDGTCEMHYVVLGNGSENSEYIAIRERTEPNPN